MSVARKQMKTAHHVKDLNLAPKGHGRIEWAGRSMPVLASIRELASLGVTYLTVTLPGATVAEVRDQVAAFGDDVLAPIRDL